MKKSYARLHVASFLFSFVSCSHSFYFCCVISAAFELWQIWIVTNCVVSVESDILLFGRSIKQAEASDTQAWWDHRLTTNHVCA